MTSSYHRNYHLTLHKRDALIEFIKSVLSVPFLLKMPSEHYSLSLGEVERLMDEHRVNPRVSRLSALVPTVGVFHTPLPLSQAFAHFDKERKMTARSHIQPSFNEIRLILNLAQSMASARDLRLVTLDGDQTLYEDGGNLAADAVLVTDLVGLMDRGVIVAVCTAAGYTQAERYEARLHGLLEGMRSIPQPPGAAPRRFYVVGGESNFVFECGDGARLRRLEDSVWMPTAMKAWSEADIQRVIDEAQAVFVSKIDRLALPATVIRKNRAVGIIPADGRRLPREVLDEVALSLQQHLSALPGNTIPWCAFNGGNDVFVDIGSKQIGVEVLQHLVGATPAQCIHIGDQYLGTGNDLAARSCSPTVWITNPDETHDFLTCLARRMGSAKIFHMAPRQLWEQAKAGGADFEYTPPTFSQDGFVHLCATVAELTVIGNHYYKTDPREYVLLVLDASLCHETLKWEPPAPVAGTEKAHSSAQKLMPHVYSPLMGKWVIQEQPMPRSDDGTFKPM